MNLNFCSADEDLCLNHSRFDNPVFGVQGIGYLIGRRRIMTRDLVADQSVVVVIRVECGCCTHEPFRDDFDEAVQRVVFVGHGAYRIDLNIVDAVLDKVIVSVIG